MDERSAKNGEMASGCRR